MELEERLKLMGCISPAVHWMNGGPKTTCRISKRRSTKSRKRSLNKTKLELIDDHPSRQAEQFLIPHSALFSQSPPLCICYWGKKGRSRRWLALSEWAASALRPEQGSGAPFYFDIYIGLPRGRTRPESISLACSSKRVFSSQKWWRFSVRFAFFPLIGRPLI